MNLHTLYGTTVDKKSKLATSICTLIPPNFFLTPPPNPQTSCSLV